MTIEKLIRLSILLFIIAIISRSIVEISFIYYAVPVLCLVYIFFFVLTLINKFRNNSFSQLWNSGQLIIPGLILLTGLWYLATSAWSVYPEVSLKRSLYFLLIAIGSVCAGMLALRFEKISLLQLQKSKSINEESEKPSHISHLTSDIFHHPSSILRYVFLPANVIIILLCLFSLITGIPSDSWNLGRGYGFGGFFGHQNLLASILLFTLPPVFAGLKKYKAENIKYKIFNLQFTTHYLLLTANLLILVLTWSRSVWLSIFIGLLFYLLLDRDYKLLLSFVIIIAGVTITIYSVNSLRTEADRIINKGFPDIYTSRMLLWEPSFNAALKGGLKGLGYGVSDPSIIFPEGATGSHYTDGVYEREKGNSFLALIEESGLIGLILFLLPVLYIANDFRIYNIKFRSEGNKNRNYTLYILHFALLSFLVHSQFEAWMVGVGSVQLPLFFVYIGLIVQCSGFKG